MSAKLEGYQTITGNIQRQISTYSECGGKSLGMIGSAGKKNPEKWNRGDTKPSEREREMFVCLLDVFITHFVPNNIFTRFLPRQTWNVNKLYQHLDNVQAEAENNKKMFFRSLFSISA